MKKFFLITIISCVVLAAVGVIGAFAAGAHKPETWAKANAALGYFEEPEESSETYSVASIVTDLRGANVEIKSADRVGVLVELKSWYDNEFSVTDKDGTLTIVQNKNENKLWFDMDFRWVMGLFDRTVWDDAVKITVPKDFGALNIKTASGNVFLKDVKADEISVNVFSGNIVLENSAVTNAGNTLRLDATSGNIFADGSASLKIEANAFSGNITLKKITGAEIVTLGATSGNIFVYDCAIKALDAKTFSGNITLTDLKGADEATLSCTSGDIFINNSAIKVIGLETFSGNITIRNLAGATKDSVAFDITRISGNIRIFGERKSGRHYTAAPAAAEITIKASLTSGNFTFGSP